MAGKPIIGIMGGIGSGKSFIAGLFGEAGCLVIDSDQQVREAYDDPIIREKLKEMLGTSVFGEEGRVDRPALARLIFSDETARGKLEGLVHPWVAQKRDALMAREADNPQVLAYIWDTPLLVETGWHRHCDALVWVDAPRALRLERVRKTRGWDEKELDRREKLQAPLEIKRQYADYVLKNASDAGHAREQVREVLSKVLEHERQTRSTEPGS